MDEKAESMSEIVVERSFRRVIFMVAFALIALAVLMVMSSKPAEAYVVAGTETWIAPTYLNEDLIIAPGGVLNLQSEVYMELTFDGEYEVRVQAGGTLNMNGGTITRDPLWPPVYYEFWMDAGSIGSFVNSQVEYAGGGSLGMWIETSALTFDGLTVTNNQFGGIMYMSDNGGFTMTNCDISNNPQVGIYIFDSATADYVFNFLGGTTINDNVAVGIYVDSLVDTNLKINLGSAKISGHMVGIYLQGVSNGNAALDFQFSDVSFNDDMGNVLVNSMTNGDLSITAFNSHFDASSLGYGIVADNLGGGLGPTNLLIDLDQSFVNDNGDNGIYIGPVSAGSMDVSFTDSEVNGNGHMFGTDGIYFPMVAPANDLFFNALRSSFNGNANRGVYFLGAGPGRIHIDMDTCMVSGNGGPGMYMGMVTQGYIDINLRNSELTQNNGNAIELQGFSGGDVSIVIDNSNFNNSLAALNVFGTMETIPGTGGMFTFTFTNNWLSSGLGSAGVRFGGSVQYFDQTSIVVEGNYFWGQESRNYGVLFDGLIRGDYNEWENLTLAFNGNEFVGLDQAAVLFNGPIYGFRYIDVFVNGNFLMDTDFDYEWGFAFWGVSGDIGSYRSLNVVSYNNVYINMLEFPFYIHAEGFRHLSMDFSSNLIVGNGITLFGLVVDGFGYGATGELSDAVLNFDSNEVYDVVIFGIFVGTWGSPVAKDLSMTFTNNHLNGTNSGSAIGIFFGGQYYYSSTEDGSFNLLMDNNEFIELGDAGVYFEWTISDYSMLNIDIRNNLLENRANFWMRFGIVFGNGISFSNTNLASALTLTFDSNQFYDLNEDAVAIWGTVGGYRNVTYSVERNTFENRVGSFMGHGIVIWGGFYYDSTDYDNYVYFSIRENTFRDLTEYGLHFGSWTATYGFRHVDIQIHDNTFENLMSVNNMDYGIYWFYEVYYQTNMYDSSLNIDITGNVFTDLGWDGIAFKNNAGWEFANFANATVNIRDNVFTSTVSGGMDTGIYLRPIWIDRSDLDNSLSITIVNNTFDSLTVDAIHFASYGMEFVGYRNVNVLISQNRFWNTYGNFMGTGVSLQGFEYWDSTYSNSLYMEISFNDARDLRGQCVYVGGPIYYYSTVEIITNDNYFSDIYNTMVRGIRFANSIYFTTDNDGFFHFTSIRNQFFDLNSIGIDFGGSIQDFRNVSIQVQDSVFVNRISNWMDHGIYFQDVFNDDDRFDNYFSLVITNNIYENLTGYGFRINQIDNYRNVDIDIMNNYFSDVYNSFDYGIYFDSNVYYTTLFPGIFTLTVTGNTFQDLNTRGIYFANDVGEFIDVQILVDNNVFRNTLSNWMDDGIYFGYIYYSDPNMATNLRMDITNNVAENLAYSVLRVANAVYSYQTVLINIVNNQFSDIYNSFNYGIYFSDYLDAASQYDSSLTINVLDNTIIDISNTGIRFSEFYDYRNATITVTNNHFRSVMGNWMDYGMYIDTVEYDSYLDYTNFVLSLTNNRFENLTQYGFVLYNIYEYRYVTTDVLNNFISDIYSNFDIGIYIGDDMGLDDPSSDGEARINIIGNEVWNLYWWGEGIYYEDIYNFRQVYLTVQNNNFYNTQMSSRTGYGIYISAVYYESNDYDTYLWADVTNNHFENLNQEGITIYGVYGYRTVFMDFLDNSFSDLYNSFNYGIYIDYIYYDTKYDSTLTMNVLRNTFTDLYSYGYYCYEIYDFRTVMFTAEYNDFVNTISNWMDYGLYLDYIYYDELIQDASLYFDVNYNTFQNLSNRGLYLSEVWDIRNVFMNFHFNQFNDVMGSFNYGVYLGGFYYIDSLPGIFDLFVSNNTFNDLISYAFRVNSVEEFVDVDMIVQDNDFSRSNYGFFVNSGVDYADTWDLLFTRNNGDNMDDYMLYLGSTSYGNSGRSAAYITVTDNTMSSSWDGFYLGDIYYYDLSNMVLVENNVLLDMRNGYGIDLGWYAENDAHVLIQGNTITGNMWSAIYVSGFEDQAFVLDIINNDMTGVQNAIYMEEPVYGDDLFTVGIITISQNNIVDLTGYGVYIDYVYWGLMDLDITNNDFRGDPLAYYGVSFFYFDYADWNSISDIDIINNVFENGFYGFYFDYQGSGSIITFEVDRAYVTNTFHTFYFDDPISSSSDVFNVKIRKSKFTNSQLSFFRLGDPGYGLFVVTITDCEVINYGSLGGYGFYMASNDGGFIRMDVYSTKFVGSSARLGDAFAGSGQLLLNFWYISGITRGVSNGWNQRIQVLWDVDVQVMIGYDYSTTAGPGIVVYVDDQFGYQSFYTTTNGAGMVTGETVAGTLITYTGTSFSGQAVHTFWATQGPYSGSAVGAFNANGSIQILLPGDNDGDGLHDGIDIDDDNDGVPDIYDDFPYDPTEFRDTDGDGIGNTNDTDDDNDGVPDTADAFPENPLEWSDIDGDGVGDNTDIDIDGDGIPNIVDSSPYNNTGFQDSDGDSVADTVDAFPYNPHEWFDNDGDGLGNNADADDDNDGVPDDIDMYPFDPTRTDTRADKQVNIDISKGTDLVSIVAILVIGLIVIFLLLFVFRPKKEEEDEGIPPREEEPEAPTEDEGLSAELDEILEEEPEEF